tara:strand:- start:3910 stop:5154 length:1245 start_codon:yes stop_codon:yes gene_type:complete
MTKSKLTRYIIFAFNVVAIILLSSFSEENTWGIIYISCATYFIIYAWIINSIIKHEHQPENYELKNASTIFKDILPSEVGIIKSKSDDMQLLLADLLHLWKHNYFYLTEKNVLFFNLSKKEYKSKFNISDSGQLLKNLSLKRFKKDLHEFRDENITKKYRWDVIITFFLIYVPVFISDISALIYTLIISIPTFLVYSWILRNLPKKQKGNFFTTSKFFFKDLIRFFKSTTPVNKPLIGKIFIFLFIPLLIPLFLFLFCFLLIFSLIPVIVYFVVFVQVINKSFSSFLLINFGIDNPFLVGFLMYFTPSIMLFHIMYLFVKPTNSITTKGYTYMNKANFISKYIEVSPKDNNQRFLLYPHLIPYAVALGYKGYNIEKKEERNNIVESLFVEKSDEEKNNYTTYLNQLIEKLSHIK